MLTVLTTCPTRDEAQSLAQKIVAARLAACVQILPDLTSVYIWNGDVQTEREHLLLIKTLEVKWDDLQTLIRNEHTYDVPEIVGLNSEFISNDYSRWLSSVLKTGTS